MKKTLIAVAVLGSFTAFAVAESNVTLYGLIDESVIVSKADHGSTNVQLASGFTAGSRWGIRGIEDLGGGNAVGFILEQGIKVDTGAIDDTGGRTFARESTLYVKGGWGQLSMGRLGTLGFAQSTAILRGSIFGTTYGPSGMTNSNNHYNHFGRADNAVAYKTPVMGGFSVHAMYSNKMNGASSDDSANKWSENSHYYGLGVLYTGGDIQGSLIFESTDNKDNSTYKNDALYHLTLGGQWKLGTITPMALYQYAWGAFKQHTGSIGANVDCAGGTFTIGGKYISRSGDDKGMASYKKNSATLWNVAAAYTYPLSKRTKTYAYAGYTDGGKTWGDEDKFKGDYMFNGWAVGIGMTHSF